MKRPRESADWRTVNDARRVQALLRRWWRAVARWLPRWDPWGLA